MTRANPGFIVDDSVKSNCFLEPAHSIREREMVVECKALKNKDVYLISSHGRVVHYSTKQKCKSIPFELDLLCGMRHTITDRGIFYTDYRPNGSSVYPLIGSKELTSGAKQYEFAGETTASFCPGMEVAPIITDDTIYLHLRRYGVVAIKDGKIKWRTSLTSYQMPMNIEYPIAKFLQHQNHLYLVTDTPYTGGAYGVNSFSGTTKILDARNGSIVGSIEYEGTSNEACITEDGVLLRVGNHYSPNVYSGCQLFAYDIETKKELWASKGMCYGLKHLGDKVFHKTINSLVCRQAKSGKILWQIKKASPFSVNYKLIYPSPDGNLYCLLNKDCKAHVQKIDANTGKIKWQQLLKRGIGQIVSEDENHLHCIGHFDFNDKEQLPEYISVSKSDGETAEVW